MNVTVASSDFQKELELLITAIPNKPSMPVLTNVLVQATDEWLRLAATDMEISIITFCHANTVEPGTVTIPAKHLLEVVRHLPNRDITLEIAGNEPAVTISAGKYTTRIPTQEARAFPKMPSIQGLEQRTYTGQLKEMIRLVRFAISDKGKKYFMDGALFTGPMLVATDGHRMSLASTNGDSTVEAIEKPVIIPKKALDALFDFIKPPAEIIYAISDRQLFFVVDGRMLIARQVEGDFPKYEKLIPVETTCQATIPSAAYLKEAVERSVLTAKDLQLTFQPEVLILTGKSTDVGEVNDQIDITYEGKPGVSVTLHGESFLDFLNEADGDKPINIRWRDGGHLLCSQGESFRYIHVPMRTPQAK